MVVQWHNWLNKVIDYPGQRVVINWNNKNNKKIRSECVNEKLSEL